MRPTSKALLIVGILSTNLLPCPGTTRAETRVRIAPSGPSQVVPGGPSQVVPPRPGGPARESAPSSTAAYWGAVPPAAPKKKPNAVRRMFHRIGTFLGADEEIGTTPTYRDPATGRTNTGASKPYMKPLEQ